MQTPEIEIIRLSKIFYRRLHDVLHNKNTNNEPSDGQDKVALNNINLTLQSGETVGIIGRNGAGKSTLLSIIAGIASQTHGKVNIIGKVTAVMTLGIGLREDLTGRENIYLDGEIQGKSREEMNSVIDRIIAFSELDDFIDKPIKTYSTGMKSRLAFSMLVEIEPEILIIDEALSAGDVFFANKATKKIREICKKGKIVILVSHSMGTIESMCTRCLWMEKGEIIMDDAPDKVTKAYLQKIREEDEQAEIKQYQLATCDTLEQAGYKIINAELKLSGSDYAQNLFYTKDSFVMDITIQQVLPSNARLTVIIERIDGLTLHHQDYELQTLSATKESETFILQLALESLVFNKGYYQLKLQVCENDAITSRFSRFFEIRNNHIPSGGFPLLDYPAQITLAKEDFPVCSDSIELITE
ncbi:ABC transporter ATP-binding protein [Legionella spiritensis]|uniref:ABC transporter of LPS O-antigen n=1 Tax=Legionella spiritensis TaxID=452 RepID=A0A0W0YYL0_LEGSP|nr:ABC transporter ATP-binding protein [Legionella spiritensis]KTD61994.1 ABC transporter of LPS O-antigen [Legionella spiritensis]SNV34903.1 ABC transporter of LPS O-antigen [Legionella spiritensis]